MKVQVDGDDDVDVADDDPDADDDGDDADDVGIVCHQRFYGPSD